MQTHFSRYIENILKQLPLYVWVIDQVFGQDGWILAKFFFLHVCLWTEMKSRTINSQKKERGQYPAILTEHLVNKGFIIWLSGKFCLRDTAGSPGWPRWLHLARSGSQSHHAIWVILPARGASHIIKQHNNRICKESSS